MPCKRSFTTKLLDVVKLRRKARIELGRFYNTSYVTVGCRDGTDNPMTEFLSRKRNSVIGSSVPIRHPTATYDVL